MSVSTSRVTVSTTATLLADPGANRREGAPMSVTLHNAGGTTVYLGGPDVATSTGLALAGSTSFTAELGSGDVLYGVVAASTQELQVLTTQT